MLGRRPARGFSLLELTIVVAITLVVAAVAIPTVVTTVQNFKLRSAASGLSGLMQKARMLAVARNAACPVATCTTSGFYAVKTSTPTPGLTYVFIDMDGSGTITTTTAENTNILVPPNISLVSTGHPSDTAILNSLTAEYALPSFSPRGLPCFGTAPCAVNSGKINVVFLNQSRPLGTSGWAAVTVTPAGRVQVWTWDGSKWQ